MPQRVLSRCLVMAALWTVCATWAHAQEMIFLVREGKPTATIVVPDDRHFLAVSAAEFMVSAVEKSTGARLPIVQEAEARAGTKVFIGATRAAERAGLGVAKLKGLSCILRASGGDLYLAGNDRSKGIEGMPQYITPASKRAVHLFLRDIVGVRWLYPNSMGLGTEIPRRSSIAVPADLNRTWTPTFDHVYVGPFRQQDGYEFNSDYASSASHMTYGGHSYYEAVPKEKYAAAHPQYFAQIGGVRNSAAGHLCIGNLDVQELVYAEMLRQLDKGFDTVQLAQTDGYRPCECETCAAIHPDPNERLWIVHDKLARRLERDRPQAKVVILSYGPTTLPPKTIPKFGKNVIIELCSYGSNSFALWHGKAESFFVYLYNWGAYHALGFAPKTTPRMIAQQVKFLRDQQVKGIYSCGLGENWGLEGPVYYIFNYCMDNPDADWQTELDVFYRAAFGKAHVPMKQFFDSLYASLDLRGASDSWTPAAPGYSIPGMPGTPETQYAYYFPPNLLSAMAARLARAKELEPSGAVRARLDMVERSFLYVQDIANIYHLYRGYRVAPTWPTFEPLAAAVKQRDARITELFAAGGLQALFDGFPAMFLSYNNEATVRTGGALAGLLGAPVNWDVDALLAKKVLPGVDRKKITARRAAAPITLDGRLTEPDWAAAEVGEFVEIALGRLGELTRVRVLYDDHRVYFAFECPEAFIERLAAEWKAHGRDGGVYGQDCVEVFLDPVGNLDRYHHFICSAIPNSFYEGAFGLHTDPLHPLYNREDKSWDGVWSYAGDIAIPAKRWTVEIAIPFKSLDVPAPTPGTQWKMNLGRERFIHLHNQGTPGADPELSLWSPNLEQRLFGSFEAMGDLLFK